MMMLRDMKPTELLAYLGSLVGMITFAQTLLHSLLPPPLRHLFQRFFDWLKEYFTRYHYVDIPETDESNLTNELYSAVKLHLSANAMSYAQKAKRVKLCRTSTSAEITWSPARSQQVPISFQGARVWWEHHITRPQAAERQPWHPSVEEVEDRRKYTLRVHKRHKERIITPYMEHILKQAQEIKHSNRQRNLYTNAKGGTFYDSYRSSWDLVPFKHPSTFDTLAMDPQRKVQIQADLQAFLDGQTFYKKTGRAWKRGYLLHGPPGTGKSSLIAAMANFLLYDVYDLELTHVRSNGELRKLLLRTTSKSLIVIEDIDCSLDLANNRARKKSSSSSSSSSRMRAQGRSGDGQDDLPPSSITLSGLLNVTDGLWSCCGEERIFVFTTNHVENLDPALLRPGRMDMHILMSFCTDAACKILVQNYLDIDEHPLFTRVEELIEDAHVTPAEVSEVLMRNRVDANEAMEELVAMLEVAKAKPWPPVPVKKAGEEEDQAVQDEVAGINGEVEEVKKAMEDEEMKKSSCCGSTVEMKGRCPYCPCHKKQRTARSEKKLGKRSSGAIHVCVCVQGAEEYWIDEGEVPAQIISICADKEAMKHIKNDEEEDDDDKGGARVNNINEKDEQLPHNNSNTKKAQKAD